MNSTNSKGLVPCHGGDPSHLPAAPDGLPMIDLATGVNPWNWPVPYRGTELHSAAADYYGVLENTILATAGGQPAIQLLPTMFKPGRVLLAAVAYEEHRYRWALAGHEIRYFNAYTREHIAQRIAAEQIQYLVIISPNNPTGDTVSEADVCYWRSLLPADGVVVIDQAFADATPGCDLSGLAAVPGIVLLRSIGKFFGLPGLRLGFVIAQPSLLAELDNRLGPWAVCGSAQWLGGKALRDQTWQAEMRSRLLVVAGQQARLLGKLFGSYSQQLIITPLFISLVLPTAQAEALQQCCYSRGVSVRVYRGDEVAYMRWGLAQELDLLATRLAGISLGGMAA